MSKHGNDDKKENGESGEILQKYSEKTDKSRTT